MTPNEVGEKYIFLRKPANLREGYSALTAIREPNPDKSRIFFCAMLLLALLAVSIPALLAAFTTLIVFRANVRTPKIVPGALNRIPFDVLFLVCVSPFSRCLSLFRPLFNKYTSLGFSAVFTALSLCTVLGLAMSFAVRIKRKKTLIKNTVVYRIVRLLGRFFRAVGRFFVRSASCPKPLSARFLL